MSDLTTLYRFFDTDDRLLYVGISASALRRFNQHRRRKDWFTELDHSTFQHFDTRDEALAAEREAIKAEKPLYNVVHNTRRLTTVRASDIKPKAAPEPDNGIAPYGDIGWQWRCDWCDKPFHTSDGHLVHYAEDPGHVFAACRMNHEHMGSKPAYTTTSYVKNRALFIEYVGAVVWSRDPWFQKKPKPEDLICSLQDFASIDLGDLWGKAQNLIWTFNELKPGQTIRNPTNVLSVHGFKWGNDGLGGEQWVKSVNNVRNMHLRNTRRQDAA